MSDEDEEDTKVKPKPPEPPRRRRKAKQLVFPKREPSVVIPPPEVQYRTADKDTCVECTCFPKETPWERKQKLTGENCQKSPRSLYELASEVVDQLKFPPAFQWTKEEVADWMEDQGFPEYRACILDNHIDGRRLLMFEDMSRLPMLNIRDTEHIKRINEKIHHLFSTEWIRFSRSIGLPPRKPLTHCTWFKSRSGPSWGIRTNWTRCDILRWMKILMPAPVYRDHWDLIWYRKPDFPKVMFARIAKAECEPIPKYVSPREPKPCKEYLVPRKFRILKNVPEECQFIWMEHRKGSPIQSELTHVSKIKKKPLTIPKKTRLEMPKISVEGLSGKALLLARRRMPKEKFYPPIQYVKSRNES